MVIGTHPVGSLRPKDEPQHPTSFAAQPVRVAYDVSLIGEHFSRAPNKTGVYRVVEELLWALLRQPNLQTGVVSVCARNPVEASRYVARYVREQQGMQGVVAVESFRSRLSLSGFYRGVYDHYHSSAFQARPKFDPRSVALRSMVRSFRYWLPVDVAPHLPAGEFDVLHSPFSRLPSDALTGGAQRVLTVYDLIPLLAPEYVLSSHIASFRAILGSLDVNRDWVATISEFTKQELCAYTGMSPERVSVTPLAASEHFRPSTDSEHIAQVRGRYGIPEGPYVLSISTLEPRKNLPHLIRCFARLIAEHPAEPVNLVLVGSRGLRYEEVFSTIANSPQLRSRVIFTGYVDDADLSAVYSAADVFVYPSLYEGFGLPPLEAMQCGVPAITSNTTSLPEVVGDAGITVDPRDEDGLCAAMLDLLRDSRRRNDLRRRGLVRAAQFTWDRCAASTAALYRRAVSAA